MIVDEFTGRIMPGRRWSEGLHQAVEAKENVPIQEENQTLATITLQNYFRLYEKLGGMTGTAKTEEKEFVEIYGLEVVQIPTNRRGRARDKNDLVFKTIEAKFNAIVEEIKERHEQGPAGARRHDLDRDVGAARASCCKRQGIPHQVLNAKEHEMEAQIIAQAGQQGRGHDRHEHGRPRHRHPDRRRGASRLGGLYVLGTERHESRRIDNQLRGRCARQGDPGATRFYLALDDELMRLFACDRIAPSWSAASCRRARSSSRDPRRYQIENAQSRSRSRTSTSARSCSKYDNVMNKQRKVVYEQRRAVLEGQDLSEEITRDLAARGNRGRRQGATRSDEVDDEWDLGELVIAMDVALRHRGDRRGARRPRPRGDRCGVPRRCARCLRRARSGDRTRFRKG